MGPYNEFAIINNINKTSKYSFAYIQEYNYVEISDDYVGKWAESLFEMPVFWHEINRPSKGLARYGITLIPPESLQIFYRVVKKDENVDEVRELMKMVEEAIKENKYIIHFGI